MNLILTTLGHLLGLAKILVAGRKLPMKERIAIVMGLTLAPANIHWEGA